MLIGAVVGVALALLTLPGVWFMLALAVVLNLVLPGVFSWWTLGVCCIIALIGELIEFLASAIGAKAAGGSMSGSALSILGGLGVAQKETPLVFPIGTVIGGVVGAGLGATIAERAIKRQTWQRAGTVGVGAAAGRAVATATKVGVAITVALVLLISTLVP